VEVMPTEELRGLRADAGYWRALISDWPPVTKAYTIRVAPGDRATVIYEDRATIEMPTAKAVSLATSYTHNEDTHEG
jgi:hypothetical protein